jgi:PHP family Zn ribbon phosphoesterase
MPFNPSDTEDEYFKQEQIELLRRQRIEANRGVEEQEKDRLKKLHWMRCPKCGMELTEVDFHKVKVDHCFGCGGMFLDKGEVERVSSYKEPGFFGKVIDHLVGTEET